MKITEFQHIFGKDDVLKKTVFKGKDTVNTKKIPERLFHASQGAGNEAALPLIRKCLETLAAHSDKKAKKLRKYFLNYFQSRNRSQDIPPEFIQQIQKALSNDTPHPKVRSEKRKEISLNSSIPLSRLHEAAEQLTANKYKKAKKIHEKGRLLAKGKGEKKVRHDITLDGHRYILSKCPKSKEEATEYVSGVLEKKGTLFVSLLEGSEVKNWYNKFWTQEKFQTLNLGDWKLAAHEEKQLYTGEKKNHQGHTPKLLETTITLKKDDKTKKITHLHYDKWIDRNPNPDLGLFSKMLDRIQELRTQTHQAIAINCKGGVGRTGLTALALHLRSEIDRAHTQGKDLHQMKVDIPALVHKFRMHRPGLLGNPEQFAQIFESTAQYYKKVSKNM